MIGVLVNSVTIILGSLIGLLLKKGIPQKFSNAIMTGVALCVVYIGISNVIKGGCNDLALIFGMIAGAITGTLLDINGKIERLDCPQMKNKWVTILEVDPRHPNVIYACGTPNGAPGFDGYSYLNGILRSCDSGATWQVISSDSTDVSIVKEGPVVGTIPVWGAFVNAETGEFVVGQPNWGLAKFPAPYEN